jgi:hypothetical protein
VQNDDQRWPLLKLFGDKGKHPERTGIASEALGLNQRTTESWLQDSCEIPKAVASVQLRQASQEFDIVGKRHGSSSAIIIDASKSR